MSAQFLVVALLVLGVVLASVRSSGGRRSWWPALVLQLAAASLLYLTLFPPPAAVQSTRLVVATEGATPERSLGQTGRDVLVALPEAPALANFERVPDLATALRRHRDIANVHIVGFGLPLRDLDAVQGRALTFSPSPLPRGVVELWSPRAVRGGARWSVSGRVHGLDGGHVELLDPARQRVDDMALATDGRFHLQGLARTPGRVGFYLRAHNARRQLVEEIEVPLLVTASTPLNVLILAGGPSPEFKYLRRWMLDAGLSLHTQLSIGAGLQIGDQPLSLDATSLRVFDLMVLDERAWRSLDDRRKAGVRDALREGLGVLFRITGPLTAVERREFRDMGFEIEDAAIVQAVAVSVMAPSTSTPTIGRLEATSHSPLTTALPLLSRQPLHVLAEQGLPLIGDEDGAPLALWRAQGQGRLGLWWLGDSYRWVLAGRSDRYGELWSAAIGKLARARGAREPWLHEHDPRVNQRVVLCGLTSEAAVVAPSGVRFSLRVDPRAGAAACASYWPMQAGWHELQGDARTWPFFVRSASQAPGLSAQVMQEATAQRVANRRAASAPAPSSAPGARWPWFLAWLLASGLLWWLERRRRRTFAESVLP